MSVPTTTTDGDRAIDAALMQGDLSKLNADQKYSHYLAVCKSLGLNPLTKPFAYIKLPNGKEILYALRDATDQLRSLRNVSVTDLTTVERNDIYIVIAKVSAGERTDAGTGAVSLAGLRGENLANAIMKAETKAKRRATLSICGLGFLDETEAEDIPDKGPQAPANGNGKTNGNGHHLLSSDQMDYVWQKAREIADEGKAERWIARLVQAIGCQTLVEVPQTKFADMQAKIANFAKTKADKIKREAEDGAANA